MPVSRVPLSSGPTPRDVEELVARDGAVIVSGVDVADDAALLAAARLAGRPSHVGNAGHVIFDVTPRPDGTDLSSTHARFPLHTDSTFLPEPHAAVALGCARAARAGGRSCVVRVQDVCSALDDAALAALGEDAFPFVVRDGERPAHVGLHPVLTVLPDGDTAARYRGDVVQMAARAGDVELQDRHVQALAAFAAALEAAAAERTFALAEGDVLLVDNRRALHGRSAIEGAATDDDRRLMRRIKLDARADVGAPAVPAAAGAAVPGP